MPKPTKPVYLGRNDTDLSVRFAIDGKRWDYHLDYLHQLMTTEYLAHYVSVGKAFAYAKKYGKALEVA